MTDEERTACNAFIKEYIDRKKAQGEWDLAPVGLMRVAYGAACEAKRAEVTKLKKENDQLRKDLIAINRSLNS